MLQEVKQMPKLSKVAILTAAVLLVQVALSRYLYPIIGKSTQTVYAIGSNINPVSGIGGQQIGDKTLGYLSGYIPFDISNFSLWIAMFIGAFVLIYLGMMIYEQKTIRVWQGKNMTQRIFAILIYGHIIVYALLLALKWNVPGIATTLLIGLVFNLLFLGAIITLAATKLKFLRI